MQNILLDIDSEVIWHFDRLHTPDHFQHHQKAHT